MDFVRWGRNPWGQWILTHVSWNLFWASLFAGVMFLVAHASYMLFSAHRKRTAAETDALEAAHKNLPPKIERHALMARLFHWVMAASMFVLLFTAFLPVVGVKFAWVQWHWIAGLVLTALDHLPHHPRHVLPRFLVDLGRPEGHPRAQGRDAARARPRRAGSEVGQVSARQPPLSPRDRGRRARRSSITGMLMMSRVRTPLVHAQPVSASATRPGASPTCRTASPASAWSAWSSRTSTSRSGPRSGGSPSR